MGATRVRGHIGVASAKVRKHRWGDAVPASRSDGVMEHGEVLKFVSSKGLRGVFWSDYYCDHSVARNLEGKSAALPFGCRRLSGWSKCTD